MILTRKYRLKDKRAAKHLREHAYACNQVWNWMVAHHRDIEARYDAGAPKRLWPSAYDLEKALAGSSTLLGIPADTIQGLCAQFVRSRGAIRRAPRFRASTGARRALGWIPLKGRNYGLKSNAINFRAHTYRWFGNRQRPMDRTFKTGAFVEDARGRWWITFQIDVPINDNAPGGEVGIDLGLTTLATTSDGAKIANIRALRPWAERLAVAQRAGNKKRVAAIHSKVANIRRDHLHKASHALVQRYGFIAVGDVSPSKLAKTRMAKSVFDAGWAMLKTMLRYKCQKAGGVFVEVNEAWSTRVCSSCGIIPSSSPKGMGGLGIRQWECSDCGTAHDRDVNAATNILNAGRSISARADDSRKAA